MRISFQNFILKSISRSFLMIVALLCIGCKNDIFVDPPEYGDETFYLDGNGGTQKFFFQAKNLKGLRFDCEYSDLADVFYFDSEGMPISNPNVSQVSNIVYAAPQFFVVFDVYGNQITVRSLDNTTQEDIKISVSMDYDDASRFINLVLSPGLPLEISDMGYDTALAVSGKRVERGKAHTFTNETEQPQQMHVYPYKEELSQAEMELEEPYSWADGVTGALVLPFFQNGGWKLNDSNIVSAALGSAFQYVSAATDAEETYTIEVPAKSKATYSTEVTYVTLDIRYIIYLKQPGSGLAFPIEGVCKLSQPIGYKIEMQ